MNAALAIALALFAQLPARAEVLFAEPVAAEVWVSEEWPADSLKALGRTPGVSVGIHTRSNMLRPEVARALARGSLVEISSPIAPAHVDQFSRMQGTRLVLTLPARPSDELRARLGRFGRQTLRIRVAKLDSATAAWLAGLKNAEVELDLRGRLPDQEELTLLLGLDRARPVIRLRGSDAPELLAGLSRVAPVRLVVEAAANRLPDAMLQALHAQPAAVRVRLDGEARAADLLRFAHLPGISFEFELGPEADRELPRLERILREATLQPAESGSGEPPGQGSVEKKAPPHDSRVDRQGADK